MTVQFIGGPFDGEYREVPDKQTSIQIDTMHMGPLLGGGGITKSQRGMGVYRLEKWREDMALCMVWEGEKPHPDDSARRLG